MYSELRKRQLEEVGRQWETAVDQVLKGEQALAWEGRKGGASRAGRQLERSRGGVWDQGSLVQKGRSKVC